MPEDALVGRTIAGKYRLEAYVGSGSMGTVYKATQVALQKIVAIKVMNPELSREATYASRFKREAKAASRLDHPASLRVIDFGDDEGLLYIAMEYLDGRDLLSIVSQEWPLATERIVSILSQVLAALAVAHDLGIVHRDLKPENVMVLRGRDDEGRDVETVKVCDFGVAKFLDIKKATDDTQQTNTATGTLTAAGMLVGTPEYMSPEQVSGQELDARSDLYSLGVILYQLLTRRLPFEGKSAIKIAIKHLEERPKAPSVVVPGVDARLEAVCLRALEKRRDARYASAREMRTDLRAAFGARDASSLGSRDLAAPGAIEPIPSSARVVAAGTSLEDEAALSKAPTLLQPAPAVGPPTPTTTEPSAKQLRARRRRSWIAVGALVVAVVLLLVFSR